jgi:protein-disulfide isomerase
MQIQSKKIIAALALLLAGLAAAQTKATTKPASSKKPSTATEKAPPPVLLPSREQIDAAMQRTFGYDPGVNWNILDIRPAPIPGIVEVLVSINKQNPYHIYMSADSQNAVVGELIPFGANPFEPARGKLQAADGPTLGAQKPVIQMIEFSDLQCPHCKSAAPILEKLVADFPQVQLRFQQFPLPASLHPWAMKAAQYADCAAREKKEAFWKFIDTVFENQGSIAAVTADDKLKELATAAGLDATKVSTCATTQETADRVNKSLLLGQSLDVNQTPTTFINGRRVLGIADIPYDNLKRLVQFEIDHAGK